MTKRDIFLAVLSGGMLAFSFPSINLSVLAWTALVPLFFALRDKSPLHATYTGLIAGFVFYVILLYWIPVPITRYGKLPLPVGILLLILLSGYLSLYTAAFSFLSVLFRNRLGIPLVISAPAIWVSLELLVTYMLTGFPWGLLGYSQYLNSRIIQIADITGVYGIGFVIVAVNSAIFRSMERNLEGISIWRGRSLWAGLSILLITLSYGHWRIGRPSPGEGISVGVVQGNINQDQKWDKTFRNETMDIYLGLTRKLAEEKTDLIVWPETAVPFYFQSDEEYSPLVLTAARDAGSPILFGSPAYEREGKKLSYLNSAYLVSPNMSVAGRYDKMHLVPFGEYVPLKKLLFFVEKMAEGIGDFSAGESVRLLDIPKARIGTLICYEGIFPDLARRTVKTGATILVNITNDAWFGSTSAPYQHLSMYALRAVENRVPVVRAANTGVSSLITPSGAIVSKTEIFTVASLRGYITPSGEKTFYTMFGDLFSYICAAMTILCLIAANLKGKRS